MKYFKRNSAAEKIFGYSKEEILCKEITLLMPERFHKAHQTGEKAGIKNPNPRLQHINPHIFRHSIYSHRKAIIGSIFDALNAGQKPKVSSTPVQNSNPTIAHSSGTLTAKWVSTLTIFPNPNPTIFYIAHQLQLKSDQFLAEKTIP